MQSNKDKTVVLISKDINLRMKAKSLGIMAQDYQNDKVANIDDLYKGIQVLEGVDHALISKLYEVPEGVNASDFKIDPGAERAPVLYYEEQRSQRSCPL